MKKNNPSKEIRFLTSHPIELRNDKESDGPGKVTGYAAVYDSVADIGPWREVVRSGAFTRAISENQDVRALWNHETGLILGRRSAGTLLVTEDDTGLRFELDLPDTQAGRDAAVSIKRGDINGMSFGFRAVTTRWIEQVDEEKELRELIDLDLMEISPVTFPAYPDTEVGLRSLQDFRADKKATEKTDNSIAVRRLRLDHYNKTRRFNKS